MLDSEFDDQTHTYVCVCACANLYEHISIQKVDFVVVVADFRCITYVKDYNCTYFIIYYNKRITIVQLYITTVYYRT